MAQLWSWPKKGACAGEIWQRQAPAGPSWRCHIKSGISMHYQSLADRMRALQGKYGKGKRQLDCAGVVTTTLAVVQRLALHEEHADLQACRLQVCFPMNICAACKAAGCRATHQYTPTRLGTSVRDMQTCRHARCRRFNYCQQVLGMRIS